MVYAASSLSSAVESRQPRRITGVSPWPVSIDLDQWTPAGIAALVPELGPVRVGNSSGVHEFWNVDLGVAAAEMANPNGFNNLRLGNETSMAMPTQQFWQSIGESGAVHYYSGSLLENDGRASLPDLQRGLDELVNTVGGGSARYFLKVWLGTRGATTPMHYDTQHNVYTQLSGTKTFWLLSPYAARHGDVHLYPRIHPLSHFVRGVTELKGSFDELWSEVGRLGWPPALCFKEGDGSGCPTCRAPHWSGRCIMRLELEAGDVLYLPPFWLHRASCASAACASANVWVSSSAMHRMEDVEAMPLPFESEWAPPTRYAAVLAFLRALLVAVHADESGTDQAILRVHQVSGPPPPGVLAFPPESLSPEEMVRRLLSTRWHRAEDELLRARADGPSRAQRMAAAAACAPPGDRGDGVDLAKIDRYARERADAIGRDEDRGVPRQPDVSWRGPRLVLVHDQLERIAHWATDGDAAATHALLQRLAICAAAELTSATDESSAARERDEL